MGRKPTGQKPWKDILRRVNVYKETWQKINELKVRWGFKTVYDMMVIIVDVAEEIIDEARAVYPGIPVGEAAKKFMEGGMAIPIRLRDIMEAYNAEPPAVLDMGTVYMFVLDEKSRILDMQGRNARIRPKIIIKGDEKTIYVVGKQNLEGKTIILAREDEATGLIFEGGKYKKLFTGKLTVPLTNKK